MIDDSYANGYANSKWVGEVCCCAKLTSSGLPGDGLPLRHDPGRH